MSLGRDKTAQVAQDVPELSHTAWAADNPLRRVTSTQPLRPGWEPLPNSSLPERDGQSTATGFARQAYNRVAAQRISSLGRGPPGHMDFSQNPVSRLRFLREVQMAACSRPCLQTSYAARIPAHHFATATVAGISLLTSAIEVILFRACAVTAETPRLEALA